MKLSFVLTVVKGMSPLLTHIEDFRGYIPHVGVFVNLQGGGHGVVTGITTRFFENGTQAVVLYVDGTIA